MNMKTTFGVLGAAMFALVAAVGGYAQMVFEDADRAGFARALLDGEAEESSALRLQTTDKRSPFVLDRRGDMAFLQFEDGYEVFALQRRDGVGGGVSYLNDNGRELVRVSGIGSVTLYPADRELGVPAARIGPAERLQTQAELAGDPGAAFAVLGTRLGAMSKGDVIIDTPAVAASALMRPDAALADAARLTASAITRMSRSDVKARALSRLSRIAFVYEAGPDVRLEANVLVVAINPVDGFAGRPSSERIYTVLAGAG